MKDKKCYLYMRVSTEMQVDGYSLDAQKASLVKYAKFQKMEIAGEYCDAGRSGKSIGGRPEFMRMLDDISAMKDEVDYVLVFKLSRFGRNAADVLNSLQYIQDYGVNLISVEDGIDSSKDSGKLTITVLSAVAEIERENILVQTMEGRKQKAREGKWNGGVAPYGYRLNSASGVLEVDSDEAEVVRMIFDRYVREGDGADKIAKYLNSRGFVRTKTRTRDLPYFTKELVKTILHNPVYVGKMKYGENTFEKIRGTRDQFRRVKAEDYIIADGRHEAIIDEELWAASQDILGSRKHINRRKFNSEHEHILSGIIKCPLCGRGLTGMVRKRNNKKGGTVENYYYRCSHGKIDEDGNRCIYSPSWNEDKFNHEVEQFLLNLINDKSYNDFIVARLSEETDVASLEEDRNRLQEQLRQALGARDKLLSMMEKLNETDRHYDKKISDMRDRLDVIYDKMTDIEEAIKDISGKIEKAHSDRLNARQMYQLLSDYGKLYDRMTKLEKKEFFSRFIERIELDPDEKDVTKCIRSIKLMFPVEYKADTKDNRLLQENTVETVVLLTHN